MSAVPSDKELRSVVAYEIVRKTKPGSLSGLKLTSKHEVQLFDLRDVYLCNGC